MHADDVLCPQLGKQREVAEGLHLALFPVSSGQALTRRPQSWRGFGGKLENSF